MGRSGGWGLSRLQYSDTVFFLFFFFYSRKRLTKRLSGDVTLDAGRGVGLSRLTLDSVRWLVGSIPAEHSEFSLVSPLAVCLSGGLPLSFIVLYVCVCVHVDVCLHISVDDLLAAAWLSTCTHMCLCVYPVHLPRYF